MNLLHAKKVKAVAVDTKRKASASVVVTTVIVAEAAEDTIATAAAAVTTVTKKIIHSKRQSGRTPDFFCLGLYQNDYRLKYFFDTGFFVLHGIFVASQSFHLQNMHELLHSSKMLQLD